MDKQQIIQLLKKLKGECGSQRVLAERIGISEQYLSDVMRGKSDPGESILKYLGLEKITRYEKTR